jgi:hypothetical protein
MSEKTAEEPSNLLEVALQLATTDPAARPRFYRELLDSNVLIVPAGESPPVIDGIIPRNTRLRLTQINIAGKHYTPFFTAESRLPRGTRYVLLPARAFFQTTRGADLVLNPGSRLGKLFFAGEVAALLDGSLLAGGTEYVAPASTKVLIGQPSEYPIELTQALGDLFKATPSVERAWLVAFHHPERDARAGLLICIDASAESMQRVCSDIGTIVGGLPQRHAFVDVIRYDGQGLSQSVSTHEPFYVKSAARKLWDRISGSIGD